jgi:CheY-like chemotaxis protein
MAAVGFTNSMPAPTAWDDSNTLVAPQSQGGNNDLLQALTALLLSASGSKTTAALPSARRRFVTSCLANQESFARVKTILGDQEYYVTAAESPDQVTSLLQSSHQLDILLLDPAFHSEQQGGASIMRYLNMLNPARRRRVFVVVVSQTYKTMDTQAAFSHGVNMIVNSNELEMLPNALAHSISDFNNLYRAFNVASGIAPF